MKLALKSMKHISWIGALAFLTCNVWADPVHLEIINSPYQKWEFQRVTISSSSTGTVIQGRLNASMTSLPPFGHIDAAAYDPSGQLVTETTAAYFPSILSPKLSRQGGVYFSIQLPKQLAPGSLVKLAFHRDPVGSPFQEKPAHSENIAK